MPTVLSLSSLRRYASLNRIRSKVPKPITKTKKNVQIIVITKPTGNIPNVRPGIKNSVVPADDCAGGLLDEPPPRFADEGESWVWLSAKAPFRNDASWGEISALSTVPSLVVPEREMVGVKDERIEVLWKKGQGEMYLAKSKRKPNGGWKNRALPILAYPLLAITKFTDELQNLERLRCRGIGSPCGPVSTRCFECASVAAISFPHVWISLSKRSPFARDPYAHPFRIQHGPSPSRGSHSIKAKFRLKDASRVVEISNIVTRRHAGRTYRAQTDFWKSILTGRFGLLLPRNRVIWPCRYSRSRYIGWSSYSDRWWAVESTSQDYVSGPANCFVDMGLRRKQGGGGGGGGCIGDGLEKESAVAIDQTCLFRDEKDGNDCETQSHISCSVADKLISKMLIRYCC